MAPSNKQHNLFASLYIPSIMYVRRSASSCALNCSYDFPGMPCGRSVEKKKANPSYIVNHVDNEPDSETASELGDNLMRCRNVHSAIHSIAVYPPLSAG